MHLIFFNSPGGANLSFGKPVYKRVWLSVASDMTEAVLEVILSASAPLSEIYVEDCLTVRPKALPKSINYFSAPSSHQIITPKRIAFFAASDTLAFLLSPVIQHFRKENPEIEVHIWHREKQNEKAQQGFESNGIESKAFSFLNFVRLRPEVIVLGNDWTADAQLIIALGRWIGTKSVCLQESVIDLADTSRLRMRWADFALLQGASVCEQVPERKTVFLTGNPRYESLKFEQTGNIRPFFLINCNFTYGVHEDQRLAWLDPVVETLDALNVDYVIAQHPRDPGDLSKYKHVVRTNAAIIHELIGRSDCIVSRFSSLLHEGLFMGKRAVYFNPHGESVGYDYRFDNQALFYAKNKDELNEALHVILESTDSGASVFQPYLEKNCHYGLGKPSESISDLLLNIPAMKGDGLRVSLLKAIWSTFKFYYLSKK